LLSKGLRRAIPLQDKTESREGRAMAGADILIAKSDLTDVRAAAADQRALAPGETRMRIERLALTSNTVTYAVAGDSFGYWKFFPAPEGFGKAPAWGFAVVEESKADGVAAGERIYGYFPLASHLTVEVAKADALGFSDAAEHRQGLSPFYNRYHRTAADPSYRPQDEGLIAAFRPLFTTAFLLDAMLKEANGFGAAQAVLSSASSKTSYSLAFLCKRRGYPVLGLTGTSNRAFVEGLELYASVATYDGLNALDPATPSAFIDMAGSAPVTRAVHSHFGDALKHSAIVGVTHWTAPRPEAPPPGIAPTLFFAPDHAMRLTKALGNEGFQAQVGEAFSAFAQFIGPHLRPRHVEGAEAVAQAFSATAKGTVDPGEILTVRV
jgi:Protein of unknown function (DUF2855)